MFLFAACVSSLEKCLFKTLSHLKIKYFFVPSYWAAYIFSFVFYLFFYWRIIALQNFVVFCQTSTWISHTATAKSLQSCLTLRPHPWDSPGKDTGVGCHFLFQCVKVKSESEVAQPCPTLRDPWTAAYQAPPAMGFSRQEYWSGLPLPSPWISHGYTYIPLLLNLPIIRLPSPPL